MFRLETQDEIEEINHFAMLLLRKTRPQLSESQRRIVAQDLIRRVIKKLALESETSEKTVSKTIKEHCELKRNNSMPTRVKQGVDFRFSAKPSVSNADKYFPKPKSEAPEDICRAKRRAAFFNKQLARDKKGPDSGRSSICSNFSFNVNHSSTQNEIRLDSGRHSINSISDIFAHTPRKLAGDRKNWQSCAAKSVKDCRKYVHDISRGAPQMKKKRICESYSSTKSEDGCMASTSSDCSDLEDVFTRLCSLGGKK